MTLKHTLLKTCARYLPDHYRPPAGVLLPFGHIVADAAPPHVRHIFAVPDIKKFHTDLEFLCRHCTPLELPDLAQLHPGRDDKTVRRKFILSFDDGMREVYDIIAPVLRAKGIPAVFFVNSATIDNKELMWRHKVSLLIDRYERQPRNIPPQAAGLPGNTLPEKLRALRFADAQLLDEIAIALDVDFGDYLRTAKPYLTTSQVLDLAREGFEIGAHSDSHPYFQELEFEKQKTQVSTSVCFLRGLGLPCRYFAFPFSDGGLRPEIFEYMAGLNIVLSFGTSEARVDSIPFSLQRFAVDAQHSMTSFPNLLKQLSAKSLFRRLSGTELIRRGNAAAEA